MGRNCIFIKKPGKTDRSLMVVNVDIVIDQVS